MTQGTTNETIQWLLSRVRLKDAIIIAKRTTMLSSGKYARHWAIVYIKLRIYAIYNYCFR